MIHISYIIHLITFPLIWFRVLDIYDIYMLYVALYMIYTLYIYDIYTHIITYVII